MKASDVAIPSKNQKKKVSNTGQQASSNGAAMAAGLALVSITIVAFPYTGGCFNPARAFAAFLCELSLPSSFWIHLLAPFVGAAAAVPVNLLFEQGRIGAGTRSD